jgi:hypothetical protein
MTSIYIHFTTSSTRLADDWGAKVADHGVVDEELK